MLQFAPVASSCRLLDFDAASVVTGFVNDTYILNVSGDKPYANMTVELVPLIYVRQPEYWGIEVVGCVGAVTLPRISSYEAHLQLDGVIGTKGIVVIGANTTKSFDVPFSKIAEKRKALATKPVYQIDKLELRVHGPTSVSVLVSGSARTSGWRNFRLKKRNEPGRDMHFDVVGTPGGGADVISPFTIDQSFPAFGPYTITFYSETNRMSIGIPDMSDPV